MRISALISQLGISSFSAEDFEFVSAKISIDPDRLILVGGQAIEVWGTLLDVPAPPPFGEGSPLTEDTDWLGGKQDAKWLCDLLGRSDTVELQLAKDFDPTLSSALAYIRRPNNRILMMDFMRAIAGPSSEEVKELAVQVRLKSGATLKVMHPLLCLESRFANLQLIPSKRKGNGPAQARWAIAIVQAFLLKMLDQGLERDQLAKACRRVVELAEYKYGPYCHTHFDLDALSAVPSEIVDAIGGEFKEKEWRFTLQRIERKRERWREIESKIAARKMQEKIKKVAP